MAASKAARICSHKRIICPVLFSVFFFKDNQSGVVRLGQGRKVSVARTHINARKECIIDAQSNTNAQRSQKTVAVFVQISFFKSPPSAGSKIALVHATPVYENTHIIVYTTKR